MIDLAISKAATEHGLETRLVRAVVTVESNFNQYSWNPEPRYRYFWDVRKGAPFRALTPAEVAAEAPPADFGCLAGDPDQEWWAQQASWGLMQVMGAVARELGSKAPYLCSLVDPGVGLHWGCLKLRQNVDWARKLTADPALALRAAVAAYNGGRGGNSPSDRPLRNEAYAAKVLSHL